MSYSVLDLPDAVDPDQEEEFDAMALELYESEESVEDESLEQLLRNLKTGIKKSERREQIEITRLDRLPEVVDDYIRNYLTTRGMNEWHEFSINRSLPPDDLELVPSVYNQNQILVDSLNTMTKEVDIYKEIAERARATYDKLRKERDYHRMHHKRVVQEKERLRREISRKEAEWERMDRENGLIRGKYELAMKEKMLAKVKPDPENRKIAKSGKVSSARTTASDMHQIALHDTVVFQSEIQTILHPEPIQALKLDPSDTRLVSCSSDHQWKLFRFPDMHLVMTGKGHDGTVNDLCWIKDRLVTVSDDKKIKVWGLKEEGISTIHDHHQAVRCCDGSERYFVTGSKDKSVRLWDSVTLKGVSTYIENKLAVNHVLFQSSASIVIIASDDKSVRLWDTRTAKSGYHLGLHPTAVRHLSLSKTVGSLDASGLVKIWDLRQKKEVDKLDFSSDPSTRQIAFHPLFANLVVAGKNLQIVDLVEKRVVKNCGDDGWRTVLYSSDGSYLVSSGIGNFKLI